MDVEFHYYITYLIAVRSGFSPSDAFIIANSAQSVDDNDILIQVNDGTVDAYENLPSQTMDITNIQVYEDIYPVFHFIPGDAQAPTAKRRDGKTDTWVTTPNNEIANKMLQLALASNDLYRIGVSAHGYVDTWAHQNFLGKKDSFNEFTDFNELEIIEEALNTVRVGHGAAKHKPDVPALIWYDYRLIPDNQRIENNIRFSDAARELFIRLATYNKKIPDNQILAEAEQLVQDILQDMGLASANADTEDAHNYRISCYKARSIQQQYGGMEIRDYSRSLWFDNAMIENWSDIKAKLDNFLNGLSDYTDFITQKYRESCTWKDINTYKTSDWYRFQEAVKAQFFNCRLILQEHNILQS